MVLITDRDYAMLKWLSVVRMADMEALRWALAAFADATQPVSLRRAQQWVARLREVGLVDRSRPALRDGSIVWATREAIGKAAPKLLHQTTRHEVAVAAVSARYLFFGWEWQRDRKPSSIFDHQADGIATRGDQTHLVEVELTPKSLHRYNRIFTSHTWRMTREGVTKVIYFCTADAERTVRREADKLVFRDDRPNVVSVATFDERGTWFGDPNQFWYQRMKPDPVVTIDPNEILESRVIRNPAGDDTSLAGTSQLF